MKNHDDDTELSARFIGLRDREAIQAPRWNPRWLQAPHRESANGLRWAFAAVAVICAVLAWPQAGRRHSLAELPALFDAPPTPLFAGLAPANDNCTTDYFLPTHLNIQLP